MRRFKSKLAILAVLAGLQASAHAGLMDPLEYVGANNTWLQLSETEGLSVNDILSGVGGWNTRYRFASAAEVQGLLAELGVVPHGYTSALSPAGGFMAMMGGTDHETSMNGTWFSNGNAGAIGRSFDAYVSVVITNGDDGMPLSSDCQAYFVCTAAYVSYDPQDYAARNENVGNFLVRLPEQLEVPEPSSLALFGLAGLALANRRRQARK